MTICVSEYHSETSELPEFNKGFVKHLVCWGSLAGLRVAKPRATEQVRPDKRVPTTLMPYQRTGYGELRRPRQRHYLVGHRRCPLRFDLLQLPSVMTRGIPALHADTEQILALVHAGLERQADERVQLRP